MGIFDGIFNTKPQQAAAGAQTAGLNNAYTDASGQINTGQATTNADYAAGLAPYTENLAVTQPGQQAYGDATGANGAAGYAKALDNFQTNPGQAYQLQVAKDAVMRGASQAGTEASGGTLTALSDRSQGIAQQNWQQYITNLLPFVGASTANAGGVAGVSTAKAGTDSGFAGKLADMAWQKDTGIGNANASADLAQTNVNGNIINAGMNAAKSIASFIPV